MFERDSGAAPAARPPLQIVADSAMPLVAELFAPFGEIRLLPGRDIGPADVAAADVLLVRSITRVDRHLLADSPVSFVGSATIGVDHVDLDYLAARAIAFANAPGCNAQAVVEYVLSALCACRPGWRGQTVGILGGGNVGGRLYRCLRALGVEARIHDPLLGARSDLDLASFADVLTSDILSLHTPLTRAGAHPTFHLIDARALAALKPGALLINTARGSVIDNGDLANRLRGGADLQVVLDVWESEPNIDTELLQRVALGTPHIAGYSREGRVRGTLMVRDALCRWLGIPAPTAPAAAAPVTRQLQAGDDLATAVLGTLDVRDDHRRMMDALAPDAVAVGPVFDRLRRTTPERHEFSHYRIDGAATTELQRELAAVGFRRA